MAESKNSATCFWTNRKFEFHQLPLFVQLSIIYAVFFLVFALTSRNKGNHLLEYHSALAIGKKPTVHRPKRERPQRTQAVAGARQTAKATKKTFDRDSR